MSTKAKAKTMAVATLDSAGTYDVLGALKAELKAMDEISSTPWRTSGKFGSGFSNNVKEEKNNENLLRMLSVIALRKKAYDEVQSASVEEGGWGGDTAPVYKHEGYTYEEWHADIILRKRINNQDARQTELRKLIEDGQKFISKEEQQNEWIKNVKSLLGKGK